MSIVAEPIVNRTAVKPFRSVCYDNNYVTSQGIFLGDDPLAFALPLLLLQISLIFIVSNALQFFLKHLGQPRVVSQILTGILLGRSVMGKISGFRNLVFPPRGTFILDTISNVSLILFLFSTSVKTELSLLRKPGWHSVAVGAAGSFLPFALAVSVFLAMRPAFPPELRNGNLLVSLAGRLSLTSFPVLCDALEEQGMLNSDLGRVALSAALITDVFNWAMSAIGSAATLVLMAGTPEIAAATVACLAAFSLFVVFVARPLALWVVRRTPAGELMKEGQFVTMMVGALLAALVTEVMLNT